MSVRGVSSTADSYESMDNLSVRAIYKPPSLRSGVTSGGSTTATLPISIDENDADDVESMIAITEEPKDKETNNGSAEFTDFRKFKGRPSSCVFVASLSAAMTDDHLCASITKHFTQWGELVMVKVLRDSFNRPYAFVQYTNDQDATTALREAQHSILDGRAIRCEPAKVNRTLYVSTSKARLLCENDIKVELELFGEVEQLLGTGANFGRTQGIVGEPLFGAWFCKFAYREDAVRAYATLRSNPEWIVEWARNIETNFASRPDAIDKLSIFVGQLDPKVTKEILTERFSTHGNIVSLNLITKPNNAFAFITYDNEASTATAVERENHSMLLLKTMHVQYREVFRSAERNKREPLLQLAPPPVNLPSKNNFQRRDSSGSGSVPPRSQFGGYKSTKNASRLQYKKHLESSSFSRNSDMSMTEMSSKFHKKLHFSPLPNIGEHLGNEPQDAFPGSNSPSPTARTVGSSMAERKSVYSITTSGDDFVEKGPFMGDQPQIMPGQMPYCCYYSPTGQPDLYVYGSGIVGPQSSGSYYYPPNYSFYYENGAPPLLPTDMTPKKPYLHYYASPMNPVKPDPMVDACHEEDKENIDFAPKNSH